MHTDTKITSIEIKNSDGLEVFPKRKENIGPFQAIGRIRCMYTKQSLNTDIFDLLNKVSKSAYSLFNEIKKNRDPKNNTAFMDISYLSKSEKVMFRKRIKELKNNDIIKKAKTIDKREPVKKNSFMINPALILCPGHQQEALSIWEILK